MNIVPEYLSKEGLEKFKKELEHLTTVKRKEIVERIEYAKSLGDLSENSEYKESREAQGINEGRIQQLEDIIKRAVIIEKGNNGLVQLGSTVKLKKDADGKIYDYTLVGPEEADISARKISNKSPIGSALMGKKKGSVVKVSSPTGETKYSIEEIS
ncbi:transcription elongation factor GreA [Candidatus Parcubacteria bacterium]|nr:MAG: transcription elongation factor GreA [Candidatus Parcubacteria bacterium]